MVIVTLVSLLFVADTNANGKSYVLVSMMQTWKEAQAYCRQYHTDLASVRESGLVWTGLYRVPWTWSDKSSSNFTNWYPGEPDNVNNNHDTEYCPTGTTSSLLHWPFL
uniref:C-type lectin domain-containing protein n=1 Tax=Lates calcarifer TaxID=8187 RepID=A0A4W6CFB3_LATCA